MLYRQSIPTGISGNEIREIREAFGLSIDQFARSLGVHPVTLNRWELKKAENPPIDGMAWAILVGLRQRLAGNRAKRKEAQVGAKATGAEIEQLLAVGGVLLALAALVYFATGKK